MSCYWDIQCATHGENHPDTYECNRTYSHLVFVLSQRAQLAALDNDFIVRLDGVGTFVPHWFAEHATCELIVISENDDIVHTSAPITVHPAWCPCSPDYGHPCTCQAPLACGCAALAHPNAPNLLQGAAERDGRVCKLGWPVAR